MTARIASCTVTFALRDEKVTKVICLPLDSHKRKQENKEAEYSIVHQIAMTTKLFTLRPTDEEIIWVLDDQIKEHSSPEIKKLQFGQDSIAI